MRMPGSGSSPPPGRAVVSAPAVVLSIRLTPRKPAPASPAPALASAYEIASVEDCGSKSDTTTIRCFRNAALRAFGSPFVPTGDTGGLGAVVAGFGATAGFAVTLGVVVALCVGAMVAEIGRASCRERVEMWGVDGS